MFILVIQTVLEVMLFSPHNKVKGDNEDVAWPVHVCLHLNVLCLTLSLYRT